MLLSKAYSDLSNTFKLKALLWSAIMCVKISEVRELYWLWHPYAYSNISRRKLKWQSDNCIRNSGIGSIIDVLPCK